MLYWGIFFTSLGILSDTRIEPFYCKNLCKEVNQLLAHCMLLSQRKASRAKQLYICILTITLPKTISSGILRNIYFKTPDDSYLHSLNNLSSLCCFKRGHLFRQNRQYASTNSIMLSMNFCRRNSTHFAWKFLGAPMSCPVVFTKSLYSVFMKLSIVFSSFLPTVREGHFDAESKVKLAFSNHFNLSWPCVSWHQIRKRLHLSIQPEKLITVSMAVWLILHFLFPL